MDLETKKPMVKDGIFRIMSMTKPVIGVAILMMMEEGKVRLQDPVSKFIPEWKDMTVAMPLPAAPGARGWRSGTGGQGWRSAAEPRYYTVPIEREVQVRDLLTHTSGVVSGTISNFANRAVAAGPKETLADYIPRLGKVPAGVPARHALGIQRGRRLRRAVTDRRSGVGDADRSIRQAAYLRSARDEGHQLHRPHRQPAAREALHSLA